MNCYIVFPEGDFDNNAILVEAASPESAAFEYFSDGLNGPLGNQLNLSATVCVMPWGDVKPYNLMVEEGS